MTLERNLALMEEKQMILRRQQDEVNRLMNTQAGDPTGRMTHSTDRGKLGLMRWPRGRALNSNRVQVGSGVPGFR